ncbi:zinc finger protein 609 [Clonorchis sinensis]|uniref:Zinc finger protein 609 n=2 Tax=Clonorchis sinensis TaxID=79923 RepID=G7YDE0_CLOSI|nr:zinc finger protein 609 [Clonorchis sinensis]
MRQRGPTATALSPGIYMDGVTAFVSGTVPRAPSLAETTATVNPPGVFATTMPPKHVSISPVLSRIQPPIQNRIMTDNTRHNIPYGQSASRIMSVSESNATTNRTHNRSMLHTKLRKKTKTKRLCASQQATGEPNRKIHPLKMTIRRTSQTHKVASDVRTATECSKLPNGFATNAAHSDPMRTHIMVDTIATLDTLSTIRCASPAQGPSLHVKPVTCVDAATSTSDLPTVTEPDPLGPCEAGTKVVVEGVVWLETAGMLVLNIQWRGRSYMGTLLDASKHSFAPSCLDSGVTSALTILRGQRGWSRGSSGRFRNRGVHHFHHLHHHRHGRHHRHHGAGASMTTRAAAAAAAAAASYSTSDSAAPNPNSVEGTSEISETSQSGISTGHSRFAIYDMDLSTGEATTPAANSQRGSKRRRRRGAGFSRPYRRVASRLNNRAEDPSKSIPPRLARGSSLNDVLFNTDKVPMEFDDSAVHFTCPFPGCKNDFPDLISMRYHFSLGHSNQDQPDASNTPSASISNEHPKPESIETSTSDQPSYKFYNQSGHSSPPPLGRAECLRVQNNDAKSTMDDRFDDNLAPPRLDRVVSIPDSSNGPSKLSHSPGLSDEPPAPSPAYSDISDDGTVPAEHNISFGEPTNSKVEGEKIFPPGQSIFSPLATSLVINPNRQTTTGEYNSSTSISSAVLKHSPNVVSGTPNGFYFPVRILSPQILAAGQSSPRHVPGSSSVMSAHALSASGLTHSPHDRRHGELGRDSSPGFSTPPIPLSAYAPLVQQTPYFVHASQPLGATIANPLPAVYIPGVNSFSMPPSHPQLTQQPPPILNSMPNTGIVNLCINDQGQLSSITPQPSSAAVLKSHSDPGSNSPRLACHVRHPSGPNR